ncbi:MAG: 1,6-anhydro-N-acetylmuramyl-L-alanine amidase AmpD [Legionellales bacterium]|nr:1,6-anhydro-N-acetylmuramyl-L-alanine amidase AmpD [Legionellales bacterium]
MKIQQHYFTAMPFIPSPNFNERPANTTIDLIVIHAISLPPDQFGGNFIEAFFLNQLNTTLHPYFQTLSGIQVSAHVVIYRDGTCQQFVPLDKRAWHAGQSSFAGRENCNDFSIGIELEGSDQQPYTAIQYTQLQAVVNCLLANYPAITHDRIVGHCDIAPNRKTDPGPHFDWERFKNGLSKT